MGRRSGTPNRQRVHAVPRTRTHKHIRAHRHTGTSTRTHARTHAGWHAGWHAGRHAGTCTRTHARTRALCCPPPPPPRRGATGNLCWGQNLPKKSTCAAQSGSQTRHVASWVPRCAVHAALPLVCCVWWCGWWVDRVLGLQFYVLYHKTPGTSVRHVFCCSKPLLSVRSFMSKWKKMFCTAGSFFVFFAKVHFCMDRLIHEFCPITQ